MSGLTAMTAIRDVGQVEPGTTVLINDASGGVGTLAVQIAKALGADVTGVCSTRECRLGPVPRRGSRRRLHQGGLHPRRAALGRHPRQRDEPPALGNGPGADPHRMADSKQHRQLGRLARGPTEDGAGGPDRAGLHTRAVRDLCGEPREPRRARHAARVWRRQGGHRRGLRAERRCERDCPHAGAPRPREGRHRRARRGPPRRSRDLGAQKRRRDPPRPRASEAPLRLERLGWTS